MSERDSLNADSFNRVVGSGIILKFQADVPVTLRILTTDPVVSETEFTDKETGEINLSTRFAFIVYNFTEGKAQILQASPNMARWIGTKHNDQDWGANIRKVDIKITPTGEGLKRRYDLEVLPKARILTQTMIDEARNIDLDHQVKDSRGRMSEYGQNAAGKPVGSGGSDTPGYDSAREKARSIGKKAEPAAEYDMPPADPDVVIDDIGDEPINFDDKI